jgi:hypothetical protein
MYAPLKKGTLLIHSGSISEPDKHHLFVVLNDPHGEDELVLLASFSTHRTDIFCDPTCVLEPGSHALLPKKSFVRYQKLRLEPAAKLMAGVSTKQMVPSYPASQALYDAMVAGVFSSPFTATKFVKFLRTALDAGC